MLKGLWELLKRVNQIFSKDEIQKREESQLAATRVQKEQQQPTASKYGMRMSRRPLGEEPLLLVKFSVTPGKDRHVLFHLEGPNSTNIEFSGDGTLFAALCRLIQQTSAQTDWGLNLT